MYVGIINVFYWYPIKSNKIPNNILSTQLINNKRTVYFVYNLLH